MVDNTLNSGYAVPFSYISTGLTNITGTYGSRNLSYSGIEIFALSDPNARSSSSGSGSISGSNSGGPTRTDPSIVYGSVPEPTTLVPVVIGISLLTIALGARRAKRLTKNN